MEDIQLTKNFTLAEFTKSKTAEEEGIKNRPTARQIEKIKIFAQDIMQPIRDHFGVPVIVSSGYRSRKLNMAVGGESDSWHMYLGERSAGDLVIADIPPIEIFQYVQSSGLPFEQLINEFNEWVHISYRIPKREILTAIKKDGETIYV